MKFQFKYIFFFLLLIIGHSIVSQQTHNPFDIFATERDSDSIEIPLTGQEKTERQSAEVKSRNPFELVSKKIDVESEIDSSNIPPIIHDRKDEQLNEIKKPTSHISVFWIGLVCSLIIAIVLNFNRTFLMQFIRSLVNMNYMRLVQKEYNSRGILNLALMHIVSILQIAIFIRFVCIYFDVPLFRYRLFTYVLTVLIYYLAKLLCLWLINGYVSKSKKYIESYIFIIHITLILLGVCLIPFNLVAAFVQNDFLLSASIFIGISLSLIFFCVRSFRSIVNSLSIILHDSFHFLLYLCTCEIVPLLIIVRYISNLT